MKGGPRKGAGRPKAAPSIPVRFNLPPWLHREYKARRGPDWVRRLMAEDLEPPWQPIATAPKDCRILLAGGDVVTVGWWQDAEDDGVDSMGADAGFVDCDFQEFRPARSFGSESRRYAGNQPTHWMPMPAGPKKAKP